MKRLALGLIFLYRKVFFFLPRRCKYIPSCSEYAIQALERHGFIKASWYIIYRLLRCNPFSRGGFDPVK